MYEVVTRHPGEYSTMYSVRVAKLQKLSLPQDEVRWMTTPLTIACSISSVSTTINRTQNPRSIPANIWIKKKH